MKNYFAYIIGSVAYQNTTNTQTFGGGWYTTKKVYLLCKLQIKFIERSGSSQMGPTVEIINQDLFMNTPIFSDYQRINNKNLLCNGWQSKMQNILYLESSHTQVFAFVSTERTGRGIVESAHTFIEIMFKYFNVCIFLLEEYKIFTFGIYLHCNYLNLHNMRERK